MFNSFRQQAPFADSWETALEATPGITRVSEENLHYLQNFLLDKEGYDSYLTSPIYYAFTGRKGLWVYEKEDSYLLICRHPNIKDQILLFPQFDQNLLPEILTILPTPKNGLRIARIKKSQTFRHLQEQVSSFCFDPSDEDVLDWKFPVHILSTSKVASLAGHEYMYVRNRLRQLKSHSVQILPYDAVLHSREMENLLHRWAAYYTSNKEEYENLYAPYESLFSLSVEKNSGLSGLIFFVNGILEAISLWDISNHEKKTGNLFVNICNTHIRGLSELLIVESCKALHDRGVPNLNLGGSEWEGLDRYKRKFHPILSIDMHSIDVKLGNVKRFSFASGMQRHA